MPMEFKYINVQGQRLKACKFGKEGGIPVLVAGPASIYMESLRLESFCCLYGVDHYWTKEAKVSKQYIDSLTPLKMAEDLESYRKGLEESGEPVESVVVLGPSAVGLTAARHAERNPDHIQAVIMMNAPLGFRGLADAQEKFLKSNYDQKFWKSYGDKCKLSQIFKESGFFDKTTLYMIELFRDERKYYKDPEVAKEMYKKWPTFNIDMRDHFFEVIINEDISFLKNVKCPVLNTLGRMDGVIPCRFVSEEQANKAPRNYKAHIFSAAAHMPSLEDKKFPSVIKQWFDKNNITAPKQPIQSAYPLMSKL